MNTRLLFLALLTAFLQSCNSIETAANNDIDRELRETIRVKNDSLLSAFVRSDMKALKKLVSEDFKKDMHIKIQKVIWPFRRRQLSTEYSVFDEFHNHHGTVPSNSEIVSEGHQYSLTFQNDQKETYVSLLRCSYKGYDDYLLTVIYGLIDGEWKINKLNAQFLGINGKTAQDLYNIALENAEKGFYMDCLFLIGIANECVKPEGSMITFEDERKIIYNKAHLQKKVGSKYMFPQLLVNVPTAPEVVDIEPVKTAEGLFPRIHYATQIPINDPERLEQEYELVKEEAGKFYKDLDFNKKYIYYRAHNIENGYDEYLDFCDTKK